MEMLGREQQARRFKPLLAAKVLGWVGAVWFVIGSIGVLYLISDAGSRSVGGGITSFFSDDGRGRVYALLTLFPTVLTTTMWIWAVAAFLWWRGNADP